MNYYQYVRNKATVAVDPSGLRIIAADPRDQPVLDRALNYIRRAGPEFMNILDRIQTGADVVVDVVDDVANRNTFNPPGSKDNPRSPDAFVVRAPSRSLYYRRWRDKSGCWYQSDSAVVLFHELVHFWRWRDNREEYERAIRDRSEAERWGNAEEKTVITQYENALQRALGYMPRDHYGGFTRSEAQPWR